jgi:predicted metalloprotease with PDZ domain
VRLVTAALTLVVLQGAAVPARAQPEGSAAASEIRYTIACPEPTRRYVLVTADFPTTAGEALVVRMSRTSPGRYALHEFAKNIFGVEAFDSQGRPVTASRTGLHDWTITGHDSRARFTYRVYGDTLDGTYLAIDETHAHMNLPATLVWAPGLEQVPVRVTLTPPPGALWRVATQLLPTGDALVFTAPNLAYLMDSPIEFGETTLYAFQVRPLAGAPPVSIRVALHNPAPYADVQGLLHDVERLVLEARAVFGEFPAFEPGHYTFITDTLPWARGDGMEHRNSTIVTAPLALPGARRDVLDTFAHEFFHAWNVERLRPRSLEPFDFTEASFSSELWFAEGFTTYYGVLLMGRTGLDALDSTLGALAALINQVTMAPGRGHGSAVAMSQLAAFEDGARAAQRTVLSNTFLSYYPFGAAIALGLDLSLRDRSDGRVSLDDFMRTMWQRHGGGGEAAPGVVSEPYDMTDLVSALTETTRDRPFAEAFFQRHVEGREPVDYGPLLERAGLRLRPAFSSRPWVGWLALETGDAGVRVRGLPAQGAPAWDGGFAEDDLIHSAAGVPISSAADWERVVSRHHPGDTMIVGVERRGRPLTLRLVVGRDPTVTIVPIERDGGRLTPEQDVFRRAWLGAKTALPAVAPW